MFTFLPLVAHFGLYLVNRGSYEDEISQEYRETIPLSKYLLKVNFYGYFLSVVCPSLYGNWLPRLLKARSAMALVLNFHLLG